jgi:hypothetical protein
MTCEYTRIHEDACTNTEQVLSISFHQNPPRQSNRHLEIKFHIVRSHKMSCIEIYMTTEFDVGLPFPSFIRIGFVVGRYNFQTYIKKLIVFKFDLCPHKNYFSE